MGRADLGVLLTSSLQHTALEYLPLWTGELLLAVPEGHSEFSQKDINSGNWRPERLFYSHPLSLLRAGQ